MADSQIKNCQNCKVAFSIAPDDFGFYEKIGVPPPTLCPQCRYQRRLLWRNERTFYHRKCDLCKKDIIACYPSDTSFPVYCQKCWWGDGWDPYSYGRDFDFSEPFFEQYRELAARVPALSIMNDDGVASTNSQWSYDFAFSKNVYLGVCGWYDENACYSSFINRNKDLADCYWVMGSELGYELFNCDKCYNCRHCTLCFDCNNCTLGYDLKGCSNCVMCVGLRNKSYCILNKQYTKEEYGEKLKELQLGNRERLAEHMRSFQGMILKFPRKYVYNFKTVNCTGDNLWNCKRSKDCFYADDVENCSFLINIDSAKDSYDCNNTGKPELCYESVTPDNSRGNKSSIFCWKCTNAEYSNNCHSCVSVFGSTGLKHGSYAILNKRYTKEEFISLREKIIAHMKETGEWGEFFSPDVSPFAYNETAALEWFPLTKEKALAAGYRWKDEEKKQHQITKMPAELPQTIQEVTDAVLNDVIGCEHKGECSEKCTVAFRLIDQELQLYRKMDVPLPTLCPNCRHYQRMVKRNPVTLWNRQCGCGGKASGNSVYQNTNVHDHGDTACPNEFATSFAPQRPEIVYCENCYQSEVS